MAESNIQEVILIGRDQSCNFIVDDPSVSRNHAQIINYGTHVCVVDLGSSNGTFVNGVRVSSETSLHQGDELKVGNVIVPWEQLASPSGGKGKKKTWLWLLIAGIVLLLIGAAVAAYFLWIRPSLEESKKENDALYEAVITGAKKKHETDSLFMDSLKEKEKEKKLLKDEKEMSEKAKAEAEKAKAEAEKEKAEAEKAAKTAKEEKKKAEEAKAEAEKAEKTAKEEKEKAEKAKEAAEQNAEWVSQPAFEATLKSMTDEEAQAVCRELGIEFNVRKPAKEALKNEFLTSGDVMKQRIGKALTKYKKQ